MHRKKQPVDICCIRVSLGLAEKEDRTGQIPQMLKICGPDGASHLGKYRFSSCINTTVPVQDGGYFSKGGEHGEEPLIEFLHYKQKPLYLEVEKASIPHHLVENFTVQLL